MQSHYKPKHGFSYNPTASPGAIAAAITWLVDQHKGTNIKKNPTTGSIYDSLGNFALFDNSGKRTYEQFNYACHYYLSNAHSPSSCVALWCDHSGHSEHLRFLDWITERSFISQFVLGKTAQGFVVSSDIPAGLMHCVAMTSRAPRMFSKEHFTYFNNLVDAGIPEEVAYLTVFCVDKGNLSTPFRKSSDHRPFACPGVHGLKAFMNGELSISRYDEKCLYTAYRSMTCSSFLPYGGLVNDLLGNPKFFKILMDSRKVVVDETYRPPNPFAKQAPGPRQGEMTKKEVYELGLPFLMKEGLLNV
jgi:hypothetical protein